MIAVIARHDPAAYRRFVVAFSGGKDSLAALLHLLSLGVPGTSRSSCIAMMSMATARPSSRLGHVTPAYVRAIADHFGIALYVSWREGGFARELARDDAPTPRSCSRRRPASACRGQRPCRHARAISPDVSRSSRALVQPRAEDRRPRGWIRNQPRFLEGRTLVITGERAEESPSRARYATLEAHRTSTLARAVDHRRPVHDWTERLIWDAIAQARIRPHPAYVLGWGRLSCRACIFGSPDQWATLRLVFPCRLPTGRGSRSREREDDPSLAHRHAAR